MTKPNELEGERKPKSIWDRLRDAAYDTVFHAGDTAQTFLWDAVYGPSDVRSENFQKRQLGKQGRTTVKPLTKKQQNIFCKILKRGENERLIDYWKRQKAMLSIPDKLRMIEAYRLKETKLERLIKDHEDSTHKQKEIAKVEKQFQKMQKTAISNIYKQ